MKFFGNISIFFFWWVQRVISRRRNFNVHMYESRGFLCCKVCWMILIRAGVGMKVDDVEENAFH